MTEDVPGYRVLEQVGEGGFSVVFRAHQERLDRMVALKVLSISAVDDGAMRRFQRECKITGKLSGHPNVVTVLDTGTTAAGRPYIAMEYFEHGALTDRLQREGPLPVADVLRIGVKMAGALAATHETDVLHRDVKPQNILVSRYGEPALADFGIARLVDSFDATHTQAFTPHHAAPEVLEGTAPGPGADIYSLGSTLYQLLAGQPAFRGPASEGIAQLMLRILNEPPPPFQRGDVPAPVAEVIGQSMAKSPDQRFGSAVEFAQRLQRLQAELGLPVTDIAASGIENVPPPLAPPPVTEPPTFPPAAGPAFTSPQPPPVPDWASTMGSGTAPPPLPGAADAPPLPGAADMPPLPGAADVPPLPPVPPWHPGAAEPPLPEAPTAPPAPPAADLPPQGFGEGAPGWPPVQTAPVPAARSGDGPRRGLIVATSVALGGGLVLGLGALALTAQGSDNDPRDSQPIGAQNSQPAIGSPSEPQGATPSGAPDPIPESQFKATRPRKVNARGVGGKAILNWNVPKAAKDLPIIVQTLPASRGTTVSAGKGAQSATVTGLKPKQGYCFRVGALLRLNQGKPATMSWSKPACIRKAKVSDN